MPIIQSIVSHDETFARLSVDPIFVNVLGNKTEEEKRLVESLLTTRFSSDMITLLPSCRCGATRMESSIEVLCPVCGTPVRSTFESEIDPLVWFQQPIGVEKLMAPIWWVMFKDRFKKNGFSVIHWLTDRNYGSGIKIPQFVSRLEAAGIERGYNFFVRNFDFILQTLFSFKEFRKKKGEEDYFELLVREHRDKVFSRQIPLPNKALLIIEKTSLGVYVDPIVVNAVDIIGMMVSIDKNFHDQNPRTKENRTARALSGLADFIESYFKVNLAPKPGQFRQHVFGTRTNFSFRCVISSLTGNHHYRFIKIPWVIGITVLKPHLINKLVKRGYNENYAKAFLTAHAYKFNEELNEIFKELIFEAGGSIPCELGRNPTLLQGSILALGIDEVKTDPSDLTISLPIGVCKSLNADFDGDATWVSLLLDKHMERLHYPLQPKFNIMQLSGKPLEISANLSLPKPVVTTVSRWLLDDSEDDLGMYPVDLKEKSPQSYFDLTN